MHRQAQHLGEAETGPPRVLEDPAELVGLAAHDDHALLVGDRAVVGDPVELVLLRRATDLRDDELDLESGFDSVVNTVPSVWAYAFARPRALTSVRS